MHIYQQIVPNVHIIRMLEMVYIGISLQPCNVLTFLNVVSLTHLSFPGTTPYWTKIVTRFALSLSHPRNKSIAQFSLN